MYWRYFVPVTEFPSLTDALVPELKISWTVSEQPTRPASPTLLYIRPQLSSVPGRVDALNAAANAIDAIFERVMRESISVEERMNRRRMVALAKVKCSSEHIISLLIRKKSA